MSSPYAHLQLGKALVTAAVHEDEEVRRAAQARVRAWTAVIDGMGADRITTGSRTPVAALPPWVTLEVLRGGFTTGRAIAAGPLESDEIRRVERLGLPRSRAAVLASYLTDDGLAELHELVEAGAYTIRIPEDAVLLVVGCLTAAQDRSAALDLLDIIRPYADTLRFMPRAAVRRQVPSGQVSRRTAKQVQERLHRTPLQQQVEAQREAAEIWQPLTDRFVELWWSARGQAGVAGARWDRGQIVLARRLLFEYEQALDRHRLCRRRSRVPGETLPRLVEATRAGLAGPITARRAAGIDALLAQIADRRGAPGSERLIQLRRGQARIAAEPSHRTLAQIAAARCALLRADEGITDIDAVLRPVSATEAGIFGVPEGTELPGSVRRAVGLGRVGELETLLAEGVLPSAEVLAELLPAVTAIEVAQGCDDALLGQVLAGTYEAFRRRRSLLLVNLERQVQFDELPWVAVPGRNGTGSSRSAAVARRVAAAAISTWPGTILPNPLVQELTTLYDSAGQSLPLVPELAADIFEGRFSQRFAQAGAVAARLLAGTLYEFYYGVDLSALLDVPLPPPAVRHRPGQYRPAAGFDRLCADAAASTAASSVARNGMVIERGQVLTTQNLAVLIAVGGARPTRSWFDLAVAAALHAAALLQLAQRQTRPLPTVKNAAAAWRQALFFLVVADPQERLGDFVETVRRSGDGARWPMSEVLSGLEFVAGGGRFDQDGVSPSGRRLLGWTVTGHWAVKRPEPAGAG